MKMDGINEAATEIDEKMEGIFSIAFDFAIVAVIIHRLPLIRRFNTYFIIIITFFFFLFFAQYFFFSSHFSFDLGLQHTFGISCYNFVPCWN